MNKLRLIGLGMLIVGVVLTIAFESRVVDFVAGIVGGFGLVWLITGRMSFVSRKS